MAYSCVQQEEQLTTMVTSHVTGHYGNITCIGHYGNITCTGQYGNITCIGHYGNVTNTCDDNIA